MNTSEQVDKYIASYSDWRGKLIGSIRRLIHEADPAIVEEWKWETPIFSHNGMICALGAFKDHVKINFFDGASLADPHKLFNAGLDAKKTRAIDIHEGDNVDEGHLKELLVTAVNIKSK